MKLVVGLGNPGERYEGTRHNLGFAALDSYLSKNGVKEYSLKKEWDAFLQPVKLESYPTKVIFAKPNTYMNLSGSAVQKIAKFYDIAAEDILVVYDEVALDLGRIRLSFDRSAGGHNGVEDIINKLGGKKNFYRLRLGVGPDPGGEYRADYVLKKFPKVDKDKVERVIYESMDAIDDWIQNFGTEIELDQKKQDALIQKYNSFTG